jgi:hypothetical protein
MVVDTEGNLLTVVVHAANIQDRDGVQPALSETHELCPSVTYAWADQSYRGDLVEWAAKMLGITIEIVTRGRPSRLSDPAAPVGCRAHDCLGQPLPTLEQRC